MRYFILATVILLSGCLALEPVKPDNPVDTAIVEFIRIHPAQLETITGIPTVKGMTPKRVPLSYSDAQDYINHLYNSGQYLVRCEVYAPQIESVDDMATMVVGHEVGIHCFEGYRHSN